MIALCSELWCNFTFARVIFSFFTNDDDDEFQKLDPRRASSRVKSVVFDVINNLETKNEDFLV